MPHRFCRLAFFAACAVSSVHLRADIPPLLAKAFDQWSGGHEDLAFTQQTRIFLDDGGVKEERVERYDPSLPDNQRWRLIEFNGKPASEEQRKKWESKKNGRPRKKPLKAPAEYLDLEHATLAQDSPRSSSFEVNFRPEAARMIAVDKLPVLITVEKESGAPSHVAATLREPLRIALGLVKITDIDLDVGLEPGEENTAKPSTVVQTGSTARVMLSKFGDPIEFKWSDFKRVKPYRQLGDAPNQDARR